MSVRSTLLAALAVCSLIAPAYAFQTDFTTVLGSSDPLVLPAGDNTLTFTAPSAPGAFSVGSTTGLYSFSTALGDFSSFSGDTLLISFATPIKGTTSFSFGLEDAFGLGGSDTLSVTSNTGVTATLTTSLNFFPLAEPEGFGFITAPGATSFTVTSANPFAIAQIATVPEPASLALLSVALLGFRLTSRRRG